MDCAGLFDEELDKDVLGLVLSCPGLWSRMAVEAKFLNAMAASSGSVVGGPSLGMIPENVEERSGWLWQVALVRALGDDDATFAVLTLLYDKGRRTMERASSRGPVVESVDPGMMVGEMNARKDVAEGLLRIRVPHLCVPWGRRLGQVLWRKLRVRLVRAPSARQGREGFQGINRLLDVQTQILYPKLSEDDARYNQIMKEAIENRFGPFVLEKISTLVRLGFLNENLSSLRKEMSNVCQMMESVEAKLRAQQADSLSAPLGRSSSVSSHWRPPASFKNRRIPVSKSMALYAHKVINATKSGALGDQRYIINGSIVEAGWLQDFRSILQERYSLVVHMDKTAPADAAGPIEVDTFLLSRCGARWTQIFPDLARESRTRALEWTKLDLMRSQSNHSATEDALVRLKDDLLARCVGFESAGAPLTEICALRVAQNRETISTEAWTSMSPYVWRLIDRATDRLRELENAAPIAAASFSPI